MNLSTAAPMTHTIVPSGTRKKHNQDLTQMITLDIKLNLFTVKISRFKHIFSVFNLPACIRMKSADAVNENTYETSLDAFRYKHESPHENSNSVATFS